jgi:magnesium transporter
MEQLQPGLEKALHEGDFTSVRDQLDNLPPSKIANVISDAPVTEQVLLFRCLPCALATTTFEYLPRDRQRGLLRSMANEEVATLLNPMADDDRTTLFEELPAVATKQLLQLLSDDERAIAVKLLGYPERSVGRLMTPHYIAVYPHWSVQQVLDYVRAYGRDSETLTMVYVINEHGRLVDDILMRSFLLAPLSATVAELMDNHFVALKASDTQAEALRVVRQVALPVTDTEGVLIGIVTSDDLLEVAEREATREIQKIGGVEALEEPYLQISLVQMVRKRAGWLVILFLGELLTATAMGFFEKEIERAVVLALFVPLLISSGGNSDSQATTLVIRAMALGEVTLRQWWQVMRREVFSGLALGVILGSIGFVRITLWSLFSDLYGPHWLLVALTVGVALIEIVLWGTLAGSHR